MAHTAYTARRFTVGQPDGRPQTRDQPPGQLAESRIRLAPVAIRLRVAEGRQRQAARQANSDVRTKPTTKSLLALRRLPQGTYKYRPEKISFLRCRVREPTAKKLLVKRIGLISGSLRNMHARQPNSERETDNIGSKRRAVPSNIRFCAVS